MSGAIPTPKWHQAPQDIREAWHDNNNASHRLMAALEQAEGMIAEMRALLTANNIVPENRERH